MKGWMKESMKSTESLIFIIIIVICVGLILYGLIKHRFDLFVNFGLRIVAGILGFYILNNVLGQFGMALDVGINGTTTLAVGLLGIPGFLLVYGIALYYFLK